MTLVARCHRAGVREENDRYTVSSAEVLAAFDASQVKWINAQLKEVWPFLDKVMAPSSPAACAISWHYVNELQQCN